MAPLLTKEEEEQLKKIYYDDSNLFGRDKLFSLIQKKDLDISRRQIMDWLKKQEIHQLYYPKKEIKNIRGTVLSKPLKQIGIDLIDMQNLEYNSFKYILTAIDLFSKKAWAMPLKNKMDKTVKIAMEKIIKKIPDDIGSIRSDNGSEFISNEFKELLKKYNIKQVLSSPSLPQSNGEVEKFNGTLKRLINKYLKINNTIDWVSDLDKLVDNYNNVDHDITKTAPNDVIEKTFRKIKKRIEKSVLPKNETKELLNVSDKVRIRIEDPKNKTNWSKKIYVIERVFKPKKIFTVPTYKLKNDTKRYTQNELLYVPAVENEFDEAEKFEISKIVRPHINDGELYYEVRWKGYKNSDNTLESRKNLLEDAPKLLRKYEKNKNVKIYYNKDKSINHFTFDE